jgi:ankyrin repeat protein
MVQFKCIDNGELSVAQWHCDLKTVTLWKFLLKNGADVNVRSLDNRTPLHEAVESENLDIVVQLGIGLGIGRLTNPKHSCCWASHSSAYR